MKQQRLSRRVYVCWCCQRDYPLLPLHHKALRRVGNGVIVYVYDNSDGKTPPPVLPSENTVAIGSDFDRKGNLNGEVCVLEMVKFYKSLTDRGVQQIVKVDADTIITHPGWLNAGGDMIGFQSSNGLYCSGCCYALSKFAVDSVYNYLTSHRLEPSAGYTLPEDATTTLLTLYAGAKVNLLHNTTEAACVGFMPPMRHTPQSIRQVKGVIHCGQWQRLAPLTKIGLDRTTIVRSDMSYALGWLSKTRHNNPDWSSISRHSYCVRAVKSR